MIQPLLRDGHRLQQHAHLAQRIRQGYDVLRILDVILREIAVPQVDAPLEIHVVGGHVLQADQVIEAVAGSAHRRDDVVPGLDGTWDVEANLVHLTEVLVPGDEEVRPLWRLRILGLVDLPVSAVHANAQHPHQDTAPVWYVHHVRLWDLLQVHGVGLARVDRDCFQV